MLQWLSQHQELSQGPDNQGQAIYIMWWHLDDCDYDADDDEYDDVKKSVDDDVDDKDVVEGQEAIYIMWWDMSASSKAGTRHSEHW